MRHGLMLEEGQWGRAWWSVHLNEIVDEARSELTEVNGVDQGSWMRSIEIGDTAGRGAVAATGSGRMGAADRRRFGSHLESIAPVLEAGTVIRMDIEDTKDEEAPSTTISVTSPVRSGPVEHEGAETPACLSIVDRWNHSGEETMTFTPIAVSPVEAKQRLPRLQNFGWRLLAALTPWGILVAVPAVIVRWFFDPSWLPGEIGVGAVVVSVANHLLRQWLPRPVPTDGTETT